jgi:hypothetical protein
MNKTDDLVKTTKNLFSVNLIILVYIFLTILSITDAQLILNSIVKLPIFNLEIELATFFILAPITLLILFIYFLIHFSKTLKSYYDKPPESISWFVLDSFYPAANKKDNQSKLFNTLEKLIGHFAIWWLLPLVNLAILYRSVYSHENTLIIIVGLFITFTNLLLLLAFYEIVLKLNNKFWNLISKFWLTFIIGGVYLLLYQPFLKTVLVKEHINLIHIYSSIIFIVIIGSIIYWSLKKKKQPAKMFLTLWVFVLITPFLLSIHYTFFSNVGEKKNISLNGQVLNDNDNIKIDLSGKKLDGADLIGVTMKNERLRNTDLQKASLADAIINGSDFEGAKLNGASFMRTSILNVKNLTFDQLKSVSTLYMAEFDSTMIPIQDSLKINYPQLFEDPMKQ